MTAEERSYKESYELRKVCWAALVGLCLGLCATQTQAAETAPAATAGSFGIAPNPFFLPENSRCNDTLPMYHDGWWHLFLMRMPVLAHYRSEDLLHWEERPVAVEAGSGGAAIGTGCVVENEGKFYCFYTYGGIGVALSDDLDHWRRYEKNPVLVGDGVHYSREHFRDPYVFFNEEEGTWWMIFCSRVPGQTSQRGGCVGLARSKDLLHWEFDEPVWAPGGDPHLECPQMFKRGDRWYLSVLARHTRCRFSDSSRGPWQRGSIRDMGTVLAHANSRPATDGQRWISLPFILMPEPRQELINNAGYEGGPLGVPRQWNFHEDGNVTQRVADEIIEAMHGAQGQSRKPLANAKTLIGEWELTDGVTATCVDESAGSLLLGDWPDSFYFEADVNFSKENMECHLLLNVDEGLTGGYEVSLRPAADLVTLRQISVWDGAQSRLFTMSPLEMQAGQPVKLRVFRSGTVVDVFVGDQIVLTHRLFDFQGRSLALEFRDGRGSFSNIFVCAFDPLRAD